MFCTCTPRYSWNIAKVGIKHQLIILVLHTALVVLAIYSPDMVFPPFEFQKSHTGKIRGLDIEALSFYGGQTGDVLKRNPSPPPDSDLHKWSWSWSSMRSETWGPKLHRL